jgi:fatty acid desaturase
MPALQAVIQMLLVVALSISHTLLWPTLFETDATWVNFALWGANWCALAFFFFSLGFIMHEGCHYHLSRKLWLNEILFTLTGVPVFGAPSLFREFHFRHHSHTNEFEDVGQRPQIKAVRKPERKRRRILMATVFAGFVNGAGCYRHLAKPKSDGDERWRRRSWLELVIGMPLMSALGLWWSLQLGVSSYLLGFFVPMVLAVWLHGWRELLEHFGMEEGGALETSRTVLPKNLFAIFMYRLLFNVNYHGAHHHWPHVPGHELPTAHAHYEQRLISEGKSPPSTFGGYLEIAFRRVVPQLIQVFRSEQAIDCADVIPFQQRAVRECDDGARRAA